MPPILSPSLSLAAARYASRRADRWSAVPVELDLAIARDRELCHVAAEARRALVRTVASRLGPMPARYLEAVHRVPRERFVLPEDIALSAFDAPLPLDPTGAATVSAPHAYLLTFHLLDLSEGDHLLELGTGTGYGAALARTIVGPRGHVTTIEIDPLLSERARRLLGAYRSDEGDGASFEAHWPGPPGSPVTVLQGDASALAPECMIDPHGRPPNKVAVTYALSRMPADFERYLPEGGCLVAPVGPSEEEQELIRCERVMGTLRRSSHGAVRYVPERH